ncbi:ABC transporter substrate-binding protein [Actinoalloteichus sp. AHMU CJ021]|uniref:Amino acid/amide ABC transporter substrate-binding protein, HAAT family (TC 3.A.1.4.-) n=1 Tax=Actinoalloteichus caeruleus DSM 43889 TaxID=1120930 RepID=A0ABT1JEV3_ACTCY|nr:ABC transporter substrate-binding protein [Actinoalloteichus caeruleus]AUS77219.1 ABC transporter substrate-binding protein [Actinoalloteichus sp. AHMU CJ021]MCP2331028.1 amino acid/amide ABC transporter substrate-binding protein, HAAT family (TC 3.A.1.4.-) [Actinoalloteichus caeruleus DSM 43889]
MRRTLPTSGAAALAVLLTLTACSSKATGTQGADGDGPSTGPGVTDTTIRLGALTDLTGPYAALSTSIVNSQQLAVEQINDEGGVCGRDLEIVVRDHGYDVQRATAGYGEIAPEVAAMPQLLGAPMLAALSDDIVRDGLLTFPQSWASSLLGHREIQVPGNVYDIDLVNGVDFLLRTGRVEPGERIGHVYLDDDYGQNAVLGARHAAEDAGLTLVEQRVRAGESDLTGQAAALRSAGVTAILTSVGPAQLASLVGVTASSGDPVPVVGNTPSYASQLLETPVAEALEDHFFLISGAPAASSDLPGVRELVAAYQERYPGDDIDGGALSGYSTMRSLAETLAAACEHGDLTREGIVEAHRSQDLVDVGLGMPMDFSDPAQPPSSDSYVLAPARGADGGLVEVEAASTADAVADYPLPTS